MTLGEGTTARAIASVRAQTAPVGDVVVVEGVRPFRAALHQGVAQVRTPYLIQVDADMVLDPDCVAVLEARSGPRIGVVAALLRDPLVGPIVGIKLFRTSGFDEMRGMRDSIIQDVDFYLRLATVGWTTVCALAPDRPPAARHTLGEHRPEYTLEYTYATYYQLALRYRFRRSPLMLARRLRLLRESAHPMAPVARLALGHGLFASEVRDVPKIPPTEEARTVAGAAAAAVARRARPDARRLLALHGQEAVDAFWQLGRSLRIRGEYATLAAWLSLLAGTPAAETWPAEAALCHAVLDGRDTRRDLLLSEMESGLHDGEMLGAVPR